MFVSRTVAAEVLMEAETNDTGYTVLKALDREGDLRFSLAYVSCSLLCNIIDVNVLAPSWKTLSRWRHPDLSIQSSFRRTSFYSHSSRRTQSRQLQREHHFVTYGKIFRAATLPLVLSYF